MIEEIVIELAIKIPTLGDVDLILSILEHLIVVSTAIIAYYLRYQEH